MQAYAAGSWARDPKHPHVTFGSSDLYNYVLPLRPRICAHRHVCRGNFLPPREQACHIDSHAKRTLPKQTSPCAVASSSIAARLRAASPTHGIRSTALGSTLHYYLLGRPIRLLKAILVGSISVAIHVGFETFPPGFFSTPSKFMRALPLRKR